MITTGMVYLDKILGGGFPENTVILISGGPGTGKTLFALNFLLEGSVRNEKCCYVTLMENKKELLRASNGIEKLSKLENYVDKKFVIQELRLAEQNSHSEGKVDLDSFTGLFRHYPKIERVVVDNVNKLLIYAKDPRQYRMKLSELVRELRKKFSCSILICETDEGLDSGHGESYECDGIIRLSFHEFEEKPRRTLEIHKLRYAKFDPKIPHEFIINSKGLELSKTALI